MATFVSGAAVSALLVNVGRRRRIVGIHAFSILAEAVLLLLLALPGIMTMEIRRMLGLPR